MCTIYVRVAALRTAQNVLAGRSLPTSGLKASINLGKREKLHSNVGEIKSIDTNWKYLGAVHQPNQIWQCATAEFFAPLKKCVEHSLKNLDPSENSSPRLVSHAGYGPDVKPSWKAPCWWLSVTVLDPQFLSFLPRRIEESATVIWFSLNTLYDFVKTFQRKSNVWNSATIGLFVPNEQQLVKKLLLFSFHINTKSKNAACIIQLKDHQIVESGKPKSKQSKKFTRKSVDFNFAAFLVFLRLIPVT